MRCQTCDGVGSTMEEAQKDCNDNMEAVACFGENLLCVVYHDILYYNEGSNHTVFRKCANRDYFEKTKHLCDKTTILDGWECTVAKCDKSNCAAVLPKPGEFQKYSNRQPDWSIMEAFERWKAKIDF